MGKLQLDAAQISLCRKSAATVADDVIQFAAARSTVAIERSILRLLDVSGIDDVEVPLANRLVERLQEQGLLGDGVSLHVGNVAVLNDLPLERAIAALVKGEISFAPLKQSEVRPAARYIAQAAAERWSRIAEALRERRQRREASQAISAPQAYVLTATGDVYEDIRHAEAVARHGGDIVAVIRSTAQSLLDYVPHGPTREGFGGTFATQENFRIMRQALDAWSDQNGRYVRLSSFSSGLCMPEIAVLGAIEGLDNMVNDALYGILYRDINMERTLVDQVFSRTVSAAAGLVINTGEDNYLRTADPISAAPSVVVSQMINFEMARRCGLLPEQIAVGNAFEIPPEVENGLLLEWAQALLTRELFPNCPVKYMPPTRYMDGNLYRTHACDTLFNLISVGTRQGIQTIGVPTEGIFTPHIHDRVLALECVKYLRTTAKDLHEEIEFKEGGIVQSRARVVLAAAANLLREIAEGEHGLFGAIERGTFGDVSRSRNGGKGLEGVFMRTENYFNPFETLLRQKENHA